MGDSFRSRPENRGRQGYSSDYAHDYAHDYERNDPRDHRGRGYEQRDAYGDDYRHRSRHGDARSRSPRGRSPRGRYQGGGMREDPRSDVHTRDQYRERERPQQWDERGSHSWGDEDVHSKPGGRGRRDSISKESVEDGHSSAPAHGQKRTPGEPTDTVVLDNLPSWVTRSQFEEALEQIHVLSALKNWRLRMPDAPRAFVQFASVDDAVTFIREYYPRLDLPLPKPPDDELTMVILYPHYAWPSDKAEERSTPKVCFVCKFANPPTRSRCRNCDCNLQGAVRSDLTGRSDAGNDPSHMLVVYPLPLTFDEQEFAKEMQRLELEKPNPAQEAGEDAPKLKSTAHVDGLAVGMGARPGSLHRIFLMRDVSTEHFYGYGFAEFWTREDATQALTRVRNSPAFTMGTSKVYIANIHMGVFLPEDREVVEETEHESFFPLLNPQLRVRYRDPRVYPSQLVVNAVSPDAAQNAKADDTATATDKKKGKKRKADGVAGTIGSKKAVPMAGQMALWQKKHDEIHSAASNKAQDASRSAANQTPLGGTSTSSVKPTTNAPIKISLSGATKFGESLNADQSTPQKSETGDAAAQQQPSSSDSNIPSYVDFSNLHCYLCKMKYKSAEDLAKHEKSRNHKEASTDNAKVEGAKRKIEARGNLFQKTPQDAPEPEGNAGTQYRDRAKERRQMFGRPAKQTSSSTKNETAEEASKTAAAAAAAATASPAKPAAQSKGMSMLLKQGWTGEGLGANGEGRTEALVTNAYQERAGLGVEGGLLGDAAELAAKKTTNDRGDYAKTAREKARDRLSKME